MVITIHETPIKREEEHPIKARLPVSDSILARSHPDAHPDAHPDNNTQLLKKTPYPEQNYA
jgi:hypothetical protein